MLSFDKRDPYDDLPSKLELQSAIDGIPATDLSALPTKLELQTVIDGIPATDLSALPTKLELQTVIDGIPATDLSDLPTKAELQTVIDGIPAADLSALPTKLELQSAIDGIPATNLSGIATRADVHQLSDGLSRSILAQPTTAKLKQELAKQYTATQQAFALSLSALPRKAELQSAVGNLPTTVVLMAVKASINSWTTTMFTQPYTGESFPGSPIQTIGLIPTINSQVTRCENKLDKLLLEVESLAARI